MIIAQFNVVPIGKGTSLSRYVRTGIEAVKKKGLRTEVTAMCTVIEAETIDEIFSAVKEAHNAVLQLGAKRVLTQVIIDDRKDKNATIETKLKKIF